MATAPVLITAERPPLPGESDRTAKETFLPVDLDGIVSDTLLDFNLFLPAGKGKLLFFRSTNLEFTNEHRLRLIDNNIRRVYVRAQEQRKYQHYLEQHLPEVLANPEIAPTKKADLLYTVSSQVVKDCLDEPRAATIVPRTRKMAEGTVDFVLRSEQSLGQLATLMATDYYTYTHSINVAVFAVALAHKLGLSRDEVNEFALGALLHDLGKSEVPVEILNKRGPLDNEEMLKVREHVVIGERLLRGNGRLGAVAMLAVKQHHEKIDGTGYPRGLATEQVHLFGRIAAIADCFDAMTTNRSYQQAMSAYDALHLMKTRLSPQFDQGLLETFIRMLRAPEAPRKIHGI